MRVEEIKDRSNRLIAKVKTLSDGKSEIYDRNNRKLGTYDPRTNETKDRNNRIVAKGNALTTLISI